MIAWNGVFLSNKTLTIVQTILTPRKTGLSSRKKELVRTTYDNSEISMNPALTYPVLIDLPNSH